MRHTHKMTSPSHTEQDNESIRLVFDAARPEAKATPHALDVRAIHQLSPISKQLGTDILYPLQPYGSGAPIFCFHDGSGSIAHFSAFAKAFAHSQPVFGLQSPFLMQRPALMPKLDQLATRYADLIRHLRPDGPHHLIGWDHGGVVAFEVARQLKRAHIEVSSLILLDSCNPMAYEHPHHIDEAQLLDAFVQDLAGFSGVTLPVCADLFRRLSSQQARLEKAFELFGQFPHILMQKEQFEARYQSYKMNVSTTLKYWPKPFDGKLTLFRSSSAQSYDRSPTADLGWQKFAAKGVEVINIAAGHYGMLKNQAAKQIAEHIQLC